MIVSLYIASACLVFISKGLPTWLSVVLGIAQVACACIAQIIWDIKNDQIEQLERRIKRLQNVERSRKANNKLKGVR